MPSWACLTPYLLMKAAGGAAPSPRGKRCGERQTPITVRHPPPGAGGRRPPRRRWLPYLHNRLSHQPMYNSRHPPDVLTAAAACCRHRRCRRAPRCFRRGEGSWRAAYERASGSGGITDARSSADGGSCSHHGPQVYLFSTFRSSEHCRSDAGLGHCGNHRTLPTMGGFDCRSRHHLAAGGRPPGRKCRHPAPKWSASPGGDQMGNVATKKAPTNTL